MKIKTNEYGITKYIIDGFIICVFPLSDKNKYRIRKNAYCVKIFERRGLFSKLLTYATSKKSKLTAFKSARKKAENILLERQFHKI